MTTHPLVPLLTAAFEGDPSVVADAFAEDASLVDNPGEPRQDGHADIESYFSAYGARRERFTVEDLVDAGDRLAIAYVLRFQADAHRYAQRGVAILDLEVGRIVRWRGVWVETADDLDAGD